MKVSTGKTRDQQHSVIPEFQKEPGTAGISTIVDNRLPTDYECKLRAAVNVHAARKALPIGQEKSDAGLSDHLRSGIENLPAKPEHTMSTLTNTSATHFDETLQWQPWSWGKKLVRLPGFLAGLLSGVNRNVTCSNSIQKDSEGESRHLSYSENSQFLEDIMSLNENADIRRAISKQKTLVKLLERGKFLVPAQRQEFKSNCSRISGFVTLAYRTIKKLEPATFNRSFFSDKIQLEFSFGMIQGELGELSLEDCRYDLASYLIMLKKLDREAPHQDEGLLNRLDKLLDTYIVQSL